MYILGLMIGFRVGLERELVCGGRGGMLCLLTF